jgi:hypothetical protein
MSTIAGWTDSTKSSFESQTEAGNNLNSFYAGILSSMNFDPNFDRDSMAENDVTQFLIDQVAGKTDVEIETMMTDLVTAHFHEAVQAAKDYSTQLDDNGDENPLYMKMSTITPLLSHIKKVLKGYSTGVGLKMGTVAMLYNYGRVVGPIIDNAFWIWENEVDQMEVGEIVYWDFVTFVDRVYYDPLIGLCGRKYGPFEAMRQMAVQIHHTSFLTQFLLAFEDETTDLVSIMFFGERGHYGYDWNAALEKYFFNYINYLEPLGGRIEGELHLHAMLFDGLLEDWFYGMIKAPICGVTEA